MQNEVIFNLGLHFGTDVEERLISYSKSLYRIQPAFYVLGKDSYPHVTLLQFKGSEQDAPRIWSQLKNLTSEAPIVHFQGLSIEIWNEWTCLWIRVRKTNPLIQLQAQAIASLKLEEYVNGTGEFYDPHATLLAWKGDDILPSLPMDRNLMGMWNISTRLVLGVSGPQFQFSKKLFF